MSELLQTPLHDWHATHGGRMVEFGGWHMPVQYSSITDEHHAVRRDSGLFDIAHMGRLKFTGPDAVRFLEHLLTNEVASLKPNQVRYSLVCDDAGGVLDDVLVTRFENWHLLVVNASNRLKILSWIEQQRRGFDVTIEDQTFEWSMLAIQGPKSVEQLSLFTRSKIADLKYYFATETEVLGSSAIISRTGYTGEDGFEVITTRDCGVRLWNELIARGSLPCGLGCRDTLRLEAAMPLFGHELSEMVDPLTAGLSFAVKLATKDFLGKPALQAMPVPPARQRVGIELAGRRIAREGTKLFASGSTADAPPIGTVTSGTFSPTLNKAIAMAYVLRELATVGTPIEADVRGQRETGTIVVLPFYRRTR